ncbi:hypothetical protein GCM10008171_19550 [Methylopila jiangsuensis]|uniref:D-alanyl-D-alanine carboxypeptidase-like core domain-containing protein n=1 Tax=Methylopila jiangsuensis TaxID=586230 RepID=A0A9W6JHV8_9HYPH|nr:M15 family metallopeptidase [Methylopila jiangsuensis]MDR6286949.1 hypothetical protein [Methylopila jiangsuensis]GLK76701.1 hypothetical protein GCM10008171_19550 [Methylopila jiangsuensis]
MAADNGARLIATLEARVNKFEKDLAKANGTARREFGAIEKRGQQMANRLETTVSSAATRAQGALKGLAGSFATGFLGGFAAGGVQGIVSEIRSATRAMSDLKAEAAKAGVGVEAFQALGYAARQNNVSLDALTDGLKELQLRADEFIVTGKGSGAEAFARLGYGADELKAKLRDPAALFVEIIGRIKALNNTAAGIRIADEIFGGTGGEQFVRFLEQGEAGIRRNMDEAKRLGLVLDKDVIEKGAELDKQFQKIADTISNNIKSAVVGVATTLASWATNVEGFLAALGNSKFFAILNKIMGSELEAGYYGAKLIDRSGAATPAGALDPKAVNALRDAMNAAGTTARANVPNRAEHLPERFVDPKLAGLQTEFRGSLAKLIEAAKEAGHDIKITSGFRSVERQQELWAAAVKKYGSEDAARKWVAPPGRSFHNKGTAADLGYGSDAARTWAHANANRFGVTFPMGNEPWHVEPEGQRGQPKDGDPDTSGLERQSTARAKVTTEADKQAAAVKRVMDALALETAQVGQTEQQQRILQELSAAGVDIHTREGQAIAAKVAELYRLKAAQEGAAESAEQLKDARQQFADMGKEATKGFLRDLRQGVSAADALSNALDRIIDRLMDMVVDQIFSGLFGQQGAAGGSGGGIFSTFLASMFGAPRAKGGRLEAGKLHLVGEEGPELVKGSGTVIPAARTAQLMAPAPPSIGKPNVGAASAALRPVVNVTPPKTEIHVANAPAVARQEESEGPNGTRRVELEFEDWMANATNKPGGRMQRILRSGYGVQKTVTRR